MPPEWVGPFDGPEAWPRSTDNRIERLGFILLNPDGSAVAAGKGGGA